MICARDGCCAAAAFAPLICVPSVSGRSEIRFVLMLAVCEAHARDLTVDPLLDDRDAAGRLLRAHVNMQAAGRFVPDFEAARVEPISLTSPEWRGAVRACKPQ